MGKWKPPLKSSVGYGGQNLEADVKEVRMLLERHMLGNHMFRFALEEAELVGANGLHPGAGVVGPAAFIFQRKVMGYTEDFADGFVKYNNKTWKALAGQVGTDGITPVAADSVSAAVGDALGNVGAFMMFCQGDFTDKLNHHYDSDKDGETTRQDAKATIASHGCCLCTLTMAATGIGRPTEHWPKNLVAKDLTPHIANKIVKDGGGYFLKGLSTFSVPGLFGMSVERYGPGYENEIGENAISLIDGHLAQGFPIAAHVDYKRVGSDGDHWILITNKTNDCYRKYDAIDPASGTKMGLTPNSAANTRDLDLFLKKMDDPKFTYQPGVLYGIASPPSAKCSEKQRNKQDNYRMVRFLLLSPA